MFEYLDKLLDFQGLPPHGFCLFWDPVLLWSHAIADALIGLAYYSIPLALAAFVIRRRDVQFGWVIWLFAAFILACGTTHFFSILTLWVPAYGYEALVKIVTAGVSLATAVALWPLLPRALALPSPAQLQTANDLLQQRVAERDAAFRDLKEAVAGRERVEAMLRQSQKMEAVGQLTGGIAHDFNNLLTVVIANLERAERLAADEPRLARALRGAMEGADRAARLTHQLLAFSRHQPLAAQPHAVNEIVAGMAEMVERTLGPEVRLRLDLGPAAGDVMVDATQTEIAILNLALNARDAMADGGDLTLATRAVDGRTLILVSDTGCGMTPEVKERVFEPFFTTKDVGQGTGLGLAQVYGFARQNGGEVEIDSEVGRGTTVILSFPTLPAGTGARRG